MDKINPEEAMKELTLMLMYLSRFTGEKDFIMPSIIQLGKDIVFMLLMS